MKKPSRPAAEPLQQTTESNGSWTFAPATPDRWLDIEALFAGCGDARRCFGSADSRAGFGRFLLTNDSQHFVECGFAEAPALEGR